jgi:solute carrier family 25 citrate transporter 1
MSTSTATVDIAGILASPVRQLPQKTQTAIAPPSRNHRPSAAVSLLSGAIAGGVEATVTYPFEFAKTRAQLQASTNASRNPFSAIAYIARTDGFGAIYTGCSTLILGTAFKAGVRFLSFDSIRNCLADEHGVLSPSRGMLAGMLAGTVESIAAVTPTERIKTALIDDAKSSRRRFRGGIDATRSILAAQGLPGLYRGLTSTTLKQSATSAVRMGSYNVLKEASRKNHLPQNSVTTFAIGALAGTITVYATQPFDTIKTRTQSAAGASTGEAFRSILTHSGVRGFWSGSTMRLGRLVFSGGIVFTVYEKIAALLSRPS